MHSAAHRAAKKNIFFAANEKYLLINFPLYCSRVCLKDIKNIITYIGKTRTLDMKTEKQIPAAFKKTHPAQASPTQTPMEKLR